MENISTYNARIELNDGYFYFDYQTDSDDEDDSPAAKKITPSKVTHFK